MTAHHHKGWHVSAGTHRSLSFQTLNNPKGFIAYLKYKSTFWPWHARSCILCSAYFCMLLILPMSCSRPEATFLQIFLFFIPSLHKSMINSDFPRKTYWATLPQMWVPCLLSFHQITQSLGISLYIWHLLLSFILLLQCKAHWTRNCLTFSLVLVWNSFWTQHVTNKYFLNECSNEFQSVFLVHVL